MKKIILIFTIVFSLTNVQAFHIIGGEFSYVCLGNNQYRITLKIYRDCYSIGAQLDDPGYIVIFDGNGNRVNTLVVPLQSMFNIDPDVSNPCIVNAPDVCVEQGTYEFNITLPANNSGYDVVYQRCCRNSSIQNVINPDEYGATYTAHIPASNLAPCNNSPVFNSYPPIVICGNNLLRYNHSATDPDGDRLEYEICTPLQGADRDCPQPGSAMQCGSGYVIPPPPYSPVPYRSPYNNSNVLGGVPLQIDRNTGMLTGIPNRIGQYVVGICIKEYRGNNLIGEYQRDFQFNVANCDRGIKAGVQADSILIENGRFVYKIYTCDGLTVNFKNTSQGASKFKWDFGVNGVNTDTSTQKDPTFIYPAYGTYNFTLVAEPLLTCSDTLFGVIKLSPQLINNFSFDTLSCTNSTAQFRDLSLSSGSLINTWKWSFGDGSTSTQQNPVHTFTTPGTFAVTLGVTDTNGCKKSKTAFIRNYPTPDINVYIDTTSCNPLRLVTPEIIGLNEEYNVEWDFGNGDISEELNPIYTYNDNGTYTLKVKAISPLGCSDSVSLPNAIRVLPKPKAEFRFTPEKFTQNFRDITLRDSSVDASNYIWKINDVIIAQSRNVNYTFADTGRYKICLQSSNALGCIDSICKTVYVESLFTYYMPNAFTPGSNSNSVYVGVGDFYAIKDFSLQIFNRWGEIIFESTDPTLGWNGKKKNTGADAPSGVYYALVKITDFNNRNFNYKSEVVLIR